MNRLSFSYQLLVVGALTLLLTACTLRRPAELADDIDRFVPPPIVAQEGTVIRLEPATLQLNEGGTARVEIWIDNVTDLTTADIELKFEPDILQVQDVDPNKEGVQIQPGDFLSPDFPVNNKADNTSGDILYTLTQIPPTDPANGSGVLATITFQAVAGGSSPLTFSQAQLVNKDAQEIPVTAQSGQITIGQPAGGPTATASPTFTSVPGQPAATPTFTSIPGVDTPTPTSTPGQLVVEPAAPATSTFTPTPSPSPSPTNTPVLQVIEIPPGATMGFCYRVQAGDTLYSLGQKFGVDPHFINRVNDLHPPGHIFQNQALFIPKQHGYGPNVYITEPNDTLTSVAEACHLPLSFLAQVNKLDPAATLQEGLALIIPIPPFPPPSRFLYPPSVFPGPYY